MTFGDQALLIPPSTLILSSRLYQIKLILDMAILSSVVGKWHAVGTEQITINLMIYHPLYFKKKVISGCINYYHWTGTY